LTAPAKRRTRSRGFTLVELLIVTVLGSLVVMATLKILVSNQQTLAAAATKIRGQRTLRSGMGIIAGELREISPSTGDLVTMGGDSVEVRVTRSFGLVCAIAFPGGNPRITVKNVGEPFARNDSIFLLAANNPLTVADDVWKLGFVSNVGSTTTCNGADTAQVLTIGGMTVGSPPDSVVVGAPVRSFLHYIYGLFTIDGKPYIARELVDSPGEGHLAHSAMVGPLRKVPGAPTFTYWGPSGTAAIVPSQVARIRLVLRTEADIPGGAVQDSIILDIHPRN
jgi:prepilin-type N-terminal cleavage/methylation domain-containing protein